MPTDKKDVDFVSEWEYMSPQGGDHSRRRSTSPETEEENTLFYAGVYRGSFFFQWLNRSNRQRARLRVERLYWESWNKVCLGTFLAVFGTWLAVMGAIFIRDPQHCFRGVSMLLVSFLPIVPGYYSLFVIYKYLRCCKGYQVSSLP